MRRLITWTTACAVLSSSAAVWAQTASTSLTAQERLDAIRHSLVETALQGATQVRSTQWLDAQGQLRDASSFRSGMEVRGVQVLSYSRDSSGQAQAKLNSPRPAKDTERAQGEAGNPSEASCTVPGHLRQVLSLSTVFEPGPLAAIHTQVRQQIATQWLSANENPWRMVALTESKPVLSTGSQVSAYEQALTRSGPPQLPWAATLRVRTQVAELKTWEKIAGRMPHHAEVALELSVQGANGQNKKFQASQQLVLPLNTRDGSSRALDEAGAAQLQALWQLWGERLGQWIGCDPFQPQVTQRGANQVQINAGGLAGVRPGDEWLLADPQAFPSQVVGPSSAALVLAKVVEVSPHHARLAVLAGPAQALKNDWRAWPAESLNR